MTDAFICDAIRTPIGRYSGALANVRPDDLAACVLRALARRNAELDPGQLNDVILGCANQAGEDNRNIARMAALLAGFGEGVTGTTINRLCGSGMDAVLIASRAIKAGEANIAIAGGVENMSRAPFVMPKANLAFSRAATIYDTTIGWRFVNPAMRAAYGTDAMPETAENVATDFKISREDQDRFAVESQRRAAAAQQAGRFDVEIEPVPVVQRKGDPVLVARDEHPRETAIDALARLQPVTGADGTVTAGNSSGVNDGAAAMIVASGEAVSRFNLIPRARIVGGEVAGVLPRVMGIGPVPAVRKLLARVGLVLADMDVIELNEAFASQSLAVLRNLGIDDTAEHVNPNGGAIALGHPLGMTGARLVMTAVEELHRRNGRYALCTMCIGVGQGIATVLERV